MKNLFISKPANLEEARAELARIAEQKLDHESETYKVVSTKKLSAAEWTDLTSSFLSDRAWLAAFSRKLRTKEGLDWSKRNCIKVTCEGQRESLLIDTQGYDYARYVAIIED